MSAKKRRKKHEEPEEHADAERWLVSYADMLTVLVGLFIVLYAISQVDQAKFDALAQSLSVGFGGSHTSVLDSGSTILVENGAVVPLIGPTDLTEIAQVLRDDSDKPHDGTSDVQADDSIDPKDLEAARREYRSLSDLAQELDESLAEKGLEGLVSYKIDERGLVVGLISNELFFVADTAELTPDSRAVIDALTPTLKKIDNELSIDGHANSLPSTQYRSNWELSSDRATQVLRRFVEQGKLDPVRIKAVGYGDARPLLPNDTAEGLRANRRVDIVVMSTEPERVRELIPRIIEEHMASLANDSVGDNSDAPASGTKD